MRLPGGLDNLRFVDLVDHAVGNIIAYGIVEQAYVLANVGNLAPQIGNAVFFDRLTVEQYRAAVGLVQPGYQVHQARFTATGTPDDRDRLFRFDLEAYLVEHALLAASIAQHHLVELQTALGALELELTLVALAVTRGQFKHAFSGSNAFLDAGVDRGQHSHRCQQHRHGKQK